MSRNSTFFETAFSSSLKRQELEELGSETHSTGRGFSHFNKTKGIVCKLCNPTLREHYALNLHCVVIIAAQRAPSDPQGASSDKTCTLQTFAIHIGAKLDSRPRLTQKMTQCYLVPIFDNLKKEFWAETWWGSGSL